MGSQVGLQSSLLGEHFAADDARKGHTGIVRTRRHVHVTLEMIPSRKALPADGTPDFCFAGASLAFSLLLLPITLVRAFFGAPFSF